MLFSSPPTSIITSLSIQSLAQTFLAAFVVTACTTHRHIHYFCRLAQTQILIEHEVQSLALTGRKLSERFLKSSLHFRSIKVELHARATAGTHDRSQTPQQLLASFANGCFANHGEEPRLQLRLAAVYRLALQDLQVEHLQHFFRVAAVLAATTRRPAKTCL